MKKTIPTLALLAALAGSFTPASAALITFNEGTTLTFLDLTLDYSNGYGDDQFGDRRWVLNTPNPQTSAVCEGWTANFHISGSHGAYGAATLFSEAAFINFTWLCDLTFAGTSGLEDPKLSFYNGWKGLQGADWPWEVPTFEYIDGDGLKVRFTWDVSAAVPDSGATAALMLLPLGLMGWYYRVRSGRS